MTTNINKTKLNQAQQTELNSTDAIVDQAI